MSWRTDFIRWRGILKHKKKNRKTCKRVFFCIGIFACTVTALGLAGADKGLTSNLPQARTWNVATMTTNHPNQCSLEPRPSSPLDLRPSGRGPGFSVCVNASKPNSAQKNNGVYSSLFRAKASGGHSKARETRDAPFLQKFTRFSLIGCGPAWPRVCKCPPPRIPLGQSPF